MRMAELSERSGVSVATIKYYRREGLLPPGTATAPNQADYGPAHLDRLRLISTLREVADLPVAAVREVAEALDDPDRSLHEVVGVAHRALDPAPDEPIDPGAMARVDALLTGAGWVVDAHQPARRTLARTLAAIDDLGMGTGDDVLQRYLDAADGLARAEVEAVMVPTEPTSRDAVVRSVVVGTLLYERVLTSLRRLAHARHSAIRDAS